MIMSKARKKKPKAHHSDYTPPDYRWRIAFETIEELTGTSPKALRRASRVVPLTASRMMVAYFMFREIYVSVDAISKELNKTRRVIYYYLDTMEEYKEISPYKEYYEELYRLIHHKFEVLGYKCQHCGALERVNNKKDLYTKPKNETYTSTIKPTSLDLQ